MIKLIIVDDDILIRESLKIIISIDKDIEVVNTLEDGKSCLDYISNNDVDVILLDMRMPIMNGEEVLAQIKARNINIKVLILTTFDEANLISSAIKYKANGYILKTSTPEKIINGIKSVYHGNGIYDNEVVSKLIVNKNYSSNNIDKYELTVRECDIVKLIAKGLSNKEISNELYLSEGTVKNYITNILAKMNLKHRTQIAIEYLR
ncbi:response regulator transcription factor [Romboutsia sedimentorum]|uniref:Stage 0 sporulation protein A homolog n=1 Tax=Romboutsia sedimentorum TaxID=1368474 RepID=A0ABT7ED89_9FIRM|nr:response regulator transcription factor [Romboutsia sedimentorum]MDK2564667.1 response regulator transcription factor [Romboutsia sedimentorum]MDK2586374.1 response regulator transcription factor [Romboutsia sedimentorum]